LRKATDASITQASTATMMKDETEAKLRNLMDGATVKEKELEVALWNSVHECAQVKKEHQDSMDEFAAALNMQRKEFEAKQEQLSDEFNRTARELELRISELVAENKLKDQEIDRLEKIMGDSAHEATSKELSLQSTLSEAKEGLGRLSAEAEYDKRELYNSRLENRKLQRETESALRELTNERQELEERISTLKTQLDHQAKMSATKIEFTREEGSATLAMKTQEFETTKAMAKQQADALLESTKQKKDKEMANMKATTDRARRELEGQLRESNQMRKELMAALDDAKNAIEEKDEAAKKLSTMTQFQIASVMKAKERANLESDIANTTAQTTLEESEKTRRVLESALRESDHLVRSLREELEKVRKEAAIAVNDSRMKALELSGVLSETNQQLDTVCEAKEMTELEAREALLAQSKVTERVQLELASARREMDRARTAKAEAMDAAQSAAGERDLVMSDLSSTRKQLDTVVRDLDASDRRGQAIHREKLETVARLRSELVKERSAVEKVAHAKELAEIDLRRAAEEREMARKELASTMRLNKSLSSEKEEAVLLSEGLKYRMSEVSAGQESMLATRYHPTGSMAADLSPRLHDPRPSSRYYA